MPAPATHRGHRQRRRRPSAAGRRSSRALSSSSSTLQPSPTNNILVAVHGRAGHSHIRRPTGGGRRRVGTPASGAASTWPFPRVGPSPTDPHHLAPSRRVGHRQAQRDAAAVRRHHDEGSPASPPAGQRCRGHGRGDLPMQNWGFGGVWGNGQLSKRRIAAIYISNLRAESPISCSVRRRTLPQAGSSDRLSRRRNKLDTGVRALPRAPHLPTPALAGDGGLAGLLQQRR